MEKESFGFGLVALTQFRCLCLFELRRPPFEAARGKSDYEVENDFLAY